MTLLEQLQAHAGGLVKIKTQLFWYGGRGWDGTPDRICLILDTAAAPSDAASRSAASIAARSAASRSAASIGGGAAAAALLLIDGAPHWVWVAQEDVEIL